MAIRYVDADSTPSGNGTTNAIEGANRAYASLNEWEAARQAVLTEVEECVCGSNGISHNADVTSTLINGWTTYADYYIYIHSDAASKASLSWSNSKYRLYVADASALQPLEDYVRIDGLQIGKSSSNGNLQACLYAWNQTASANDIRISNCLLRQAGNNTYTEPGIYFNAATIIGYIWNCCVYGLGTNISAGNTAIHLNSLASASVYSCIAIGGLRGIGRVAGTVTAKNCYAHFTSTGGVGYAGTFSTFEDCAASDTTGSESGLDSIAYSTSSGAYFTNLGAGTEDFHITASSALINVGTDTSGDAAPMNFTVDIDGETRTGTWDIGPDEYVAGSTPLTAQLADDAFIWVEL